MATGEATGETSVTGALVNATTGEMTIRKCDALEDMRACFALQKEVWKFSDADLIPVRMFVVASKIGGHVIGAFDESDGKRKLVGFALAIPGNRNGHSYLHSHMLAVRQQYRNVGLGRRMKLYQRDHAALQRESVWDYVVAIAGRLAQRPPGGGVVDEVEASGSCAGRGSAG